MQFFFLLLCLVVGFALGVVFLLVVQYRARKNPNGKSAKILKALSSGGGGGPDPGGP